ncbi:AlbA family DNA-binding domain-containing protein [Brucella tritici]|uniref:AlbA family DNA-binding domain-containing protein n=1 Tax=Brucella tritici TaxID=94626 RepID=UPI003D6D09F8
MAALTELERLLSDPREDLGVEYKSWLNLSENEHRAVLAKAAIALVNHGGGFIVLGMAETAADFLSEPRPDAYPEITQDLVNSAIARYVVPEFHAKVHLVTHPGTKVVHPIISLPSTLTEPVMSKRGCDGVIIQAKCYIRKAGPKSEEPRSPDEWRSLLNRCVRAGRDDMLEAIRSIVTGKIESAAVAPSALEQLDLFSKKAFARWQTLTEGLDPQNPAKFPAGHYEFSALLVGASPTNGLVELKSKLEQAQRVQLTGWSPFLHMHTPEWTPYPHEELIEAWVGREAEKRAIASSAHSDFWRVSQQGELYTIRGYSEDSLERIPAGKVFDVTLPIWRVGECILFAARLAKEFENVSSIAIRCHFRGLSGRVLTSVTGLRHMNDDRISSSDENTLSIEVPIRQVEDNLAEVLHQLLRPLYEQFAFFPLSMVLVEQELNKLTNRTS